MRSSQKGPRRFPRRFGRYILEKTLSRGGMGEVFLAVVRRFEQRCVIKTIRGDLTGEEEFVGRFADEAKILVRAGHPNIIRYFDAGRVEGDYYIAMEYVHGRDLGDVLDRAYERGEAMPSELGLYIAANLLDGLHYAHELRDEQGRPMRLVHRDVSPQNVLIGFDGSVKLIDFGLARTELLPNRTQGALAVGKYGYMSPEQARHEPLDGRADVYSAGVMLFEVFTGDRLVDEQDQATLWQRVLNPKHRSPRTVLPSLDRRIDDLVMRAVATKPQDRFTSAKAMAETARRIRGGQGRREGLVDYLRYLYPRVDMKAPPIPKFDQELGGTEKSVIIASSREGAKSVFGRGELPIEGTMQFSALDLKHAIDRRRAALVHDEDETTGSLSVDPSLRFAQHPLGDDEKTRAEPPRSQFDAPSLFGPTGLADSGTFEDEATIMMTAPPAHLSEVLSTGEHPTSLDLMHDAMVPRVENSNVPTAAPSQQPTQRPIKDIVSAQDLPKYQPPNNLDSIPRRAVIEPSRHRPLLVMGVALAVLAGMLALSLAFS